MASGNHFFLHFQRLLLVIICLFIYLFSDYLFIVSVTIANYFPSSRSVFFNEILRFSFKWKPSLKLVEANFLRKTIFQLMQLTDFLASRNQFFSPFFGDPCQFFFRLVEKYFSRKSFFSPNGNGV